MATKDLYIVSFGDSDQYRTTCPDCIKQVSDKVKAYLSEKFPGTKTLDFTLPTVSKVPAGREADYTSYPELDADAVERIKQVLADEMDNRAFQKSIDRNAPFADINPDAL